MARTHRTHYERVSSSLNRPQDYPDYLGDVLYAAGKAQDFAKGMFFSDFVADDKTIFAVIRCLEIMGEAIRRTSNQVLERYPQIPWRQIVDMRNRLVHNYSDVDLLIVWDALDKDIPHLIAVLEPDYS